MSYTKEHLENLISKAEEEFCDWLNDVLKFNSFPYKINAGMTIECWNQSDWSDVSKHFAFCFILKNTGAPCADETLDIFRDSLLDAASDCGYIDF